MFFIVFSSVWCARGYVSSLGQFDVFRYVIFCLVVPLVHIKGYINARVGISIVEKDLCEPFEFAV